jgi:hypothetical protein
MSHWCPLCHWKMYIETFSSGYERWKCQQCNDNVILWVPPAHVGPAYWRYKGTTYTQEEMTRLVKLKAFL